MSQTEKSLTDSRIMQKISYNKRKNRMMDDLIRELDKTGSIDRT